MSSSAEFQSFIIYFYLTTHGSVAEIANDFVSSVYLDW
jgi:hypothetical protein